MLEKKSSYKGWLYIAPTLVLMLIFTFYPLVNVFRMAFLEGYNQVDGLYTGIGFGNFLIMFQTLPVIGQLFGPGVGPSGDYIFVNTFIIVFVTVPISTLLALLMAVGLNSIKKLQKVFQTIFFLPYVTNSIAIGLVFAVLFKSTTAASPALGLINAVLDVFGKDPVNWIGQGSSHFNNMFVLCTYIIWSGLAFKILLFMSGLQNIDKQYYQAAQIDGTPKWRVFTKITVPLLSPIIFYILLTSFIGAFKEYSSVVGLFGDGANGGQVGTVVWYVYQKMSSQTGLASAACIILFSIIMVFTLINMKLSKKRVHY